VIRIGSSVPCSRSPTTEYADRVDGTITGTSNRYSSEMPMRVSSLEVVATAGAVSSWTVGAAMKISGRIVIVKIITKRLRR
jgi:hypothetical protein